MMSETSVDSSRLGEPEPLRFDHALWRRRSLRDTIARYLVGTGGIAIIGSIILIFLFLFAVVFPLFKGADLNKLGSYSLEDTLAGEDRAPSLFYAIEEQAEIAMRLLNSGAVQFFDINTGTLIKQLDLLADSDAKVSSWAQVSTEGNTIALALDTGKVLIFQHQYSLKYDNDQRTIVPGISYPYGHDALDLNIGHQEIKTLAVGENEEGLTFYVWSENGPQLIDFEKQFSLFDDDEATLELKRQQLLPDSDEPKKVLISPQRRWLYILDQQGVITYFDIRRKDEPVHVEDVSVLAQGSLPTSFEFLIGGISLLLADDRGNIHQLFLVRDEDGTRRLQRIRGFTSGTSEITGLITEHLRKGFLATDTEGKVSVFHTTASRHLITKKIADGITHLGIAPRSDKIIAEDISGQLHVWELDSEHPEVSWRSIWGKVWYEHYPKPDYIWQSSSASSDFEPKFSLTPLTFGTFKAAFYAMLVAMPLAICGAIFTAYFMAPKMRGIVKPSIEIMEALPTVILGFLAGLWLAPFVENHLLGVFSILIGLPLGILLASLVWWYRSERSQPLIPDGWQAALLIPVVFICGWTALAISPWLEEMLFGGDLRAWLTDTMGIGYDQRNSIIIGIAMGFAVIPTIFSITEDAIFSVPKNLSSGSLAMGATPWQTLVRVVLPSASPGIFSATMIGLGRAVGETMIVLMATGNTPVMDFSVFEGMRTLSANIAVELPESEVDSTHYRILFLAALVLFLFTFFFNTIAEIVRQRLRKKYSTL